MNTHTEENAKTKWCPFIRFHGDYTNGGGNNRHHEEIDFFCIGPRCMAWVWEPVTKEVRISGDHGMTEVETVIDHEALPTHGRCGLVKG